MPGIKPDTTPKRKPIKIDAIRG